MGHPATRMEGKGGKEGKGGNAHCKLIASFAFQDRKVRAPENTS